jgi:peptidoglycan-associated lipoprotein
MKKVLLFCMSAAVILFFQGCASKPVSVPLSERVSQSTGTDGQQQGLDKDRGRGSSITEEDLARREAEKRRLAEEEAARLAKLSDIFFEFDSYTIRSEDTPILTDLAAFLAAKPAALLTVEGHCDERGTTEYNLALGQKRAEAAKDYLVKSGVSGKRIKAISYGKEAPMQTGHTESDWSRNRRAHFTIEQKNQ